MQICKSCIEQSLKRLHGILCGPHWHITLSNLTLIVLYLCLMFMTHLVCSHMKHILPTLTQISSQNMKKLTFKKEPCSYFNWQAASILFPPWPALIITPARVWLLLSRGRLCFICYGVDASLKKYRGDLFSTHLLLTYFHLFFFYYYFFAAKWCPWLWMCVCVCYIASWKAYLLCKETLGLWMVQLSCRFVLVKKCF